MNRVIFSALLSHWLRHKVQFVTLFLGLALATALWSGVQSINAQARASYDDAAGSIGQRGYDKLVSENGVSLDDFVRLRRLGYLVSPELEGLLVVGADRVQLTGFDPLTSPPRVGMASLDEQGLFAFLSDQGLVLASPETAKTLTAFWGDDGPIVQVSAEIPIGQALTDVTTAQSLLKAEYLSALVIAPDQPFGLPPITNLDGYAVIPAQGTGDLAQLTDSFHLNLTAFGLLSFAVGLFIVQSAIGLAFEQRRSTFRTLRAMGIGLKRLVTLLAVELGLIALLAGLVGIVLGYGIAASLLPGVAGTLRGLYGAAVSGDLSFDPVWAISGLAMTMAGAAVAGAQALWRVVRMPILAPALPRAWAMSSARTLRFQAFAGLGLLGFSGLLAMWGSGLIAGFACLASLLIGAAIVLPPMTNAVLKMAGKLPRSPLGQWIVADTRQQVPALSLALMALLLALSANVGVATMVGSFRATFVGWLDQRLAAEIYVTARTPQEAEDIRRFAAPLTTAALPIWSVEATLLEQNVDIYGIIDHPTYRDNWPLLQATQDVWDEIGTGQGVLVNEQFARRNGITVGTTLSVTDTWPLPVVGIYSDYGNPHGQLITALAPLESRFPNRPKLRYAYRIAPDQAGELARDIREKFNLPASAVVNQSDVKQMSLRVFDQTFLVTGALNVLTLGVASFALLTSLLTLSTMRLPQLAPVWSLGITTKTLSKIEFWRSLALAVFTWILSIPVGLALAWVLLSIVNVEAFGWKLPMYLFPTDWFRLGVLAVLAAAVACFWPIYRLRRVPSAQLLRVFSNER